MASSSATSSSNPLLGATHKKAGQGKSCPLVCPDNAGNNAPGADSGVDEAEREMVPSSPGLEQQQQQEAAPRLVQQQQQEAVEDSSAELVQVNQISPDPLHPLILQHLIVK
ncbi:hypothetical protein E2562_003643 [Oryza meyeriana var. granulata]|uniref:Uncharacterized protein n=1 Tax=Oryza meyeriana var. granulata TaxID=110450 RepID=A0A6G1C2S3_9ORYZ|nr:hypothetical protein E2562_003643 [Oryza meyeriana var. granulata]